jgi:hypothetical protein
MKLVAYAEDDVPSLHAGDVDGSIVVSGVSKVWPSSPQREEPLSHYRRFICRFREDNSRSFWAPVDAARARFSG